jgi:hypothetical protein
MKIGGPFLDPIKKRRRQAKSWYLSYFVPKKNPDGSIVMREGRPVLERKRPYYKSKDEAAADKPAILAQYGSAGTGTDGAGVLTREQVAEFEAARAIVPEFSLVDVAKFFRLHHPSNAVRRIRELAPRFVEDVRARHGETAHFADMKSRIGVLLVAHFGERIPATVTRAEALAWLRSFPGEAKSGRTVLNLKQAACNFFNWLIEQGEATANPFAGIKRRQLPKILPNEIRFLALEEVEAYLRAAERYDPELVAHELIQLLAGVRADDEMANFRGEWVMPQTREIVIPAAIAKTGAREVLNELEPAFWI